jgi:hypothetical protein
MRINHFNSKNFVFNFLFKMILFLFYKIFFEIILFDLKIIIKVILYYFKMDLSLPVNLDLTSTQPVPSSRSDKHGSIRGPLGLDSEHSWQNPCSGRPICGLNRTTRNEGLSNLWIWQTRPSTRSAAQHQVQQQVLIQSC